MLYLFCIINGYFDPLLILIKEFMTVPIGACIDCEHLFPSGNAKFYNFAFPSGNAKFYKVEILYILRLHKNKQMGIH